MWLKWKILVQYLLMKFRNLPVIFKQKNNNFSDRKTKHKNTKNNSHKTKVDTKN